MKLADLTDSEAVRKALREFDRMGRERFLRQYGFGPARAYFLEESGRQYDSKAIAGAAIGFQYPASGPLKAKDFSGGELTVAERLKQLGFTVIKVKQSDWDGKSPADLRPGDQRSVRPTGTVS